jgi:cephalosporin hydroxylase
MDDETYLRNRKQAVDVFHTFYYAPVIEGYVIWGKTFWMGYMVHKYPTDLWIYQEMLFELKPDVIVETGVMNGGGLAFYASMCRMLGKGEVIGIDIELTESAKQAAEQFPEITLIEGSSTDPGVIDMVRKIVNGRNALVILDSDHSMEHVLREMQLYKEFIQMGGYMVIEDSNINGHPVLLNFGPGPYEAIEQFFKINKEFEIDKTREKFLLTSNPNGYLRRVREPAKQHRRL